MKICQRCKELKSTDDFQKDKSRKDGFNKICKSCKRKYDRGRKCNYSKTTLEKKHERKLRCLYDSYIITTLLQHGFEKQNITSDLIELKRKQIILKRTIHELQRNNQPISRC